MNIERLKAMREQNKTKSKDSLTEAYIKFEQQLKYLWESRTTCSVYADKFQCGDIKGINVSKNGLELILGGYSTWKWASWLDCEEYEYWSNQEGIIITDESEEGEEPEYYGVMEEKSHKSGKEFIHCTLFKKESKYLDDIIENVKVKIFYDEAEITLDSGTIHFDLDKDKINIDMITEIK